MRNDDKLLDAVIDLGLAVKALTIKVEAMGHEMKDMKELIRENSKSINTLADTLMTILPNHEKRIRTLEMRKVG